MKQRRNSWIHLLVIVVIALMPLRVLTANANLSASASSVSIHQLEDHQDHQDCHMDTSCSTDCQISTTHCTSTSLVIPSSSHGVLPLASYQPVITDTADMQSISNRNLFRPPRNNA